jgi:hypothetical protein
MSYRFSFIYAHQLVSAAISSNKLPLKYSIKIRVEKQACIYLRRGALQPDKARICNHIEVMIIFVPDSPVFIIVVVVVVSTITTDVTTYIPTYLIVVKIITAVTEITPTYSGIRVSTIKNIRIVSKFTERTRIIMQLLMHLLLFKARPLQAATDI